MLNATGGQAILHHTVYQYQWPVAQSWHLAHLKPRDRVGQRLVSHRLTVRPAPTSPSEGVDYFGNPTSLFALHAPHRGLEVVAESTLEVDPEALDASLAESAWDTPAALQAGAQGLDTAQYLAPSPRVPRSYPAICYARESFVSGRPFLDALVELTLRIHQDFEFDPTASTVTTPIDAVLKHRRGVCQDFAQVMIACLRGIGVPARYVSGYLVTDPPPGSPRLQGADASHAWVAAWCPGQGWVDVDPTNGRRVDQDFVTLAWGRDFSDVTPLRGVVLGGGEQQLEVRVTVTPVSR